MNYKIISQSDYLRLSPSQITRHIDSRDSQVTGDVKLEFHPISNKDNRPNEMKNDLLAASQLKTISKLIPTSDD